MDYFDDYNELDEMIDELKQTVIRGAKEEIRIKIKALEKENSELKYRLAHLTELEEAAKTKMRMADSKINDAKREAARIRVAELFADIGEDAWVARAKSDYISEKCDKCDDNRKIHFKSPSGREYMEDCECSKRIYVYTPIPVKLGRVCLKNGIEEVNFYIQEDSNRARSDRGYLIGDSEIYYYLKYQQQSFDDIDYYRTFFMKLEDCQKFCDYKNDKEKDK